MAQCVVCCNATTCRQSGVQRPWQRRGSPMRPSARRSGQFDRNWLCNPPLACAPCGNSNGAGNRQGLRRRGPGERQPGGGWRQRSGAIEQAVGDFHPRFKLGARGQSADKTRRAMPHGPGDDGLSMLGSAARDEKTCRKVVKSPGEDVAALRDTSSQSVDRLAMAMCEQNVRGACPARAFLPYSKRSVCSGFSTRRISLNSRSSRPSAAMSAEPAAARRDAEAACGASICWHSSGKCCAYLLASSISPSVAPNPL
jgi:hypothetical protein